MSGRSNKQLSAEELASFVGRTGHYQARAGMTVEIRVTNARESYGRLDLLVAPIAGTGEAWISTALIKLDPKP